MIEHLAAYWLAHFNYWAAIAIMMVGLYTVTGRANMVKKIAGLNILQSAVFLLYVGIGAVTDGSAPIVAPGFTLYANPLPHVLMLTAIVVGVAVTALAFALVVRVKEEYGAIEEDALLEIEDGQEDRQW